MSSETTTRRLLLAAGGLAAVGLTSLGFTLVASDDAEPAATAATATVLPSATTTVSPPSTTTATTTPVTASPATTTSATPQTTSPATTVPPLGEGQVWVFNGAQQSVGLFDFASEQLQWVSPSKPSLPESPDYQSNGGTATLFLPATGQLWVGKSSELVGAAFAEGETTTLPTGSRVVVRADGAVLVVADDGWYELELVVDGNPPAPPSTDPEPEESTATVVGPAKEEVPDQFDDDTVVTAVGGTLVYLNSDGTLFTDSGQVQIPGDDAVLQQAGADNGSVLVASSAGLFQVELASMADPVRLHEADGAPARPVRAGECIYAAWSGDKPTWFKSCTDEAPVTTLFSTDPVEGELVFRVNGASVALNAVANGKVWVERAPLANAVDEWAAAEEGTS